MKSKILENLNLINKRIEKACLRSGRKSSEITILPVTKRRPPTDIKSVLALGFKRVGENTVQESREKYEKLKNSSVNWCLIGHLQTNKAKYVAQFAHELHSLDSIKLAKELEKHLQIRGRSMDVLIQVNSSNEPQKYGIHPEQIQNFIKELTAFSSIKVKGLMTLALVSKDESPIRHCFKRMSDLQEHLRQDGPTNMDWNTLSMGMSGDFEMAIEQGSTEIRLGQALFGPR